MFALIAATLRYTGLLWLWRVCHRRGIVILTVHGVGDTNRAHAWEPLRARLPTARLDECLSMLKRSYRFVSLADAVAMLAGRQPLQPGAMVLTFDDGYRNHLTDALPILETHRVPATVFVATGPAVTRTPFWFDRLDYAIQRGVQQPQTVAVGGRRVTLDPSSRSRLASSFAELRRAAKGQWRDDRAMNAELTALSEALERQSGHRLADIVESDSWSAVLTADEIRSAADRVAFGSHTVDHLRVNRLEPEIACGQLSESKRQLETWTGQRCRFFCYPDGGVSARAAELVREVGYEAAVTTARGLNYVGADLMHLHRIDLPVSGSASELLVDVSGLKDWLLGLRTRLRSPAAVQRAGAAPSGRSNAPAS